MKTDGLKRSALAELSDLSPEAWFISDHAIESLEEDRFDHAAVARSLVFAIKSNPRAVCIGLIGEFGSGKSSVANLTRTLLANDKSIDSIQVSADRHSGFARRRNLVNSIASEIATFTDIDQRDIDKIIKPLRSSVQITVSDHTDLQLIRLLREIPAKAWLFCAIAFLVALSAAYLAYDSALPLVSSVFTVVSSVSVLALATAILWPVARQTLTTLFEGATVHSTTPRAEATDEVERVFAEVVRLHREKRGSRRLVIFVDDIDRLDPDDLLDGLRAIKSLQAVPKGTEPVFVISCDDRVLVEAISQAENAPSSADESPFLFSTSARKRPAAKAFVEKFFSIRIYLPPLVMGDVLQFANSRIPDDHYLRCKVDGRELQQILRTLIPRDFASPRRAVIRINAFLAQYHLASIREQSADDGRRIHTGDVTGNLRLLARVTVLREEFPRFFEGVTESPELLSASDRFLLGQQLTGTEELLLFKYKILRKDEANSESGSADSKLEWIAEPDLRSYLLSTARPYEPGYWRKLVPIIYLAERPSGRKVGSAFLNEILESIGSGDVDSAQAQVDALPVDAHEELAHDLADEIEHAQPVDLENMVPAAISILPKLSSGHQALAEAIVDQLKREPVTPVSPDDLILLIEHSSLVDKEFLHQSLVAFHEWESAEDRDARMRIAFNYAIKSEQFEAFRSSFGDYLDSSSDHVGWVAGELWLEQATNHSDQIDKAFVNDSVIPALLELARGATDIDLEEDGKRLTDLMHEFETPESDDLDELVLLLTDEPNQVALACICLAALGSSYSPEKLERLRLAVDNAAVETEIQLTAADLIALWSPEWIEDEEVAPEVIAEFSEIVRQSVGFSAKGVLMLEKLSESGQLTLDDPVSQSQLSAVSMDGLLSEVETNRVESLAVARRLLSLLDSLPETTANSLVEKIIKPLDDFVDVNDEDLQFGLELLTSLNGTKIGQKRLEEKGMRWATILAKSPGQIGTPFLLFRKLSETSPQISDKAQQQFLDQLKTKSSQNQLSQEHLSALTRFPWTLRQLPAALDLIDTHFAEIPDPDDSGVFDLVHLAIESNAEVPEDLMGAYVEMVCRSPTGKWPPRAATILDKLTSQQRSKIFTISDDSDAIRNRLNSATFDELDGSLRLALDEDDKLVKLIHVIHDEVDEHTIDVATLGFLQSILGKEVELTEEETLGVTKCLSPDSRTEICKEIATSFPMANPVALPMIQMLNRLGCGTSKDDRVAIITGMLENSTPEIARELGLLSKVDRRLSKSVASVRDGLKENGKDDVFQAFEIGRRRKTGIGA